MKISDLYGKQILTNTGRRLGLVEDVILDMESMGVSDLLLVKIDELSKGENLAKGISKNTVKYARVRSVSESIVVSDK
ncbi:MAG: PRC-barrel domain-containing protein [Nitrososphaeria archaeon]